MTDTVKNKNNLIITCFVFCLILFLFFILVSINKPFIFDEADYAGFSRGIVEKGLPLYYHSEDPNEWHNLASNPEYNDIKEELSQALAD